MNRRKYYPDQLVDDDDLNAGETYTYNAIGNLMSDVGIFGIITGGDVTEQGVPSMSVDLSTPFIGYNQAGERVYKATGDVIDCSVDYLGNPTVPSVGGESVWISIHGRFAYTEEDPKVIEGDTKYLTWAESYEWRVVVGIPAVAPGHAKPAEPGDAILIADIELINGQTTILTADIDESRKDTFVFTNADGITVAAGGWTKLDAAAVTVQDALDSADNELISRNGAGEIDQTILAEDQTKDIGSAAKPFGDVYAKDILNDGLGTETLGTAGNPYNESHVETAFIQTKLEASADGKVIGDATKRFNAFLNSVEYHGNLAGTFLFDAAKSVTVRVPPDQAMHVGAWTWNPANGWNCVTSPFILYWFFKPPHGAVLQSARIRWYQVTNKTMVAQLTSLDEDSVEANIGTPKTITANGANVWDEIDNALGEPIDLETKTYRCKIATATAEENRAFFLEITYDISDILKAALTRG